MNLPTRPPGNERISRLLTEPTSNTKQKPTQAHHASQPDSGVALQAVGGLCPHRPAAAVLVFREGRLGQGTSLEGATERLLQRWDGHVGPRPGKGSSGTWAGRWEACIPVQALPGRAQVSSGELPNPAKWQLPPPRNGHKSPPPPPPPLASLTWHRKDQITDKKADTCKVIIKGLRQTHRSES